MRDTTYYDDETLLRARTALLDAGVDPVPAIGALLNAGILLRDRDDLAELRDDPS